MREWSTGFHNPWTLSQSWKMEPCPNLNIPMFAYVRSMVACQGLTGSMQARLTAQSCQRDVESMELSAQPSKMAAGPKRDGARVRRKVKIIRDVKQPLKGLITKGMWNTLCCSPEINGRSLQGLQFSIGRFRGRKHQQWSRCYTSVHKKIRFNSIIFSGGPVSDAGMVKVSLPSQDPTAGTLGKVSQGTPGIQRREKMNEQSLRSL